MTIQTSWTSPVQHRPGVVDQRLEHELRQIVLAGTPGPIARLRQRHHGRIRTWRCPRGRQHREFRNHRLDHVGARHVAGALRTDDFVRLDHAARCNLRTDHSVSCRA